MTKANNYGKSLSVTLILSIGLVLWFMNTPQNLSQQGWHLLILFVLTISLFIVNPVPMGVTALLSIFLCTVTGTLTLETALSGFSSNIVWLVVFAFFISQGFIVTNLGNRIAYNIILRLGKSTLGLSYALVFIDFVLAPFIPSVSARGAGVIFPIAKALSQSYVDSDHSGASSKNGGFLMKVCYQSNVITSSMFVTSMAANPLAVKLASDAGIRISWLDWALASIVPGIVSLLVMPLVVYYLHPPAIRHSESAPQLAKIKLEAMGKLSNPEVKMMLIFMTLVLFWVFGDTIGLSSTTAALGGLCAMYLLQIIKFEDTVSDKNTWSTFIWFATLIMLSGCLSNLGIINWMKSYIEHALINFSPTGTTIFLCLVYFYIHYFFASATTHIAVLFPTFLALLIGNGMPSTLSALILSFLSILSSGVTQFALSSGPIFFSPGYIKTQTWWYIGFVLSVIYLLIWSIVGGVWWKVIGLY